MHTRIGTIMKTIMSSKYKKINEVMLDKNNSTATIWHADKNLDYPNNLIATQNKRNKKNDLNINGTI